MPAWCKRPVHPNPTHIRVNQQANERMNGNPAYLGCSKVSISVVIAVVGLNGDRLVAGPWCVLSFDHPLV
jgi:hypothetical protein